MQWRQRGDTAKRRDDFVGNALWLLVGCAAVNDAVPYGVWRLVSWLLFEPVKGIFERLLLGIKGNRLPDDWLIIAIGNVKDAISSADPFDCPDVA
jgi:hypothetical protein